MATPPYTRTWIQNLTSGRSGTRLTGATLQAQMRAYLYGLTNFLGSNGLTIQFSSNSVTAGAGNNIAASTNWVRGATTATAQSWMILKDGNNGQLLIAYTGATDDIAYIGYSPLATYTGTGATTVPTATDEIVVTSGTALIGAVSTSEQVWHCAVSSDARAYRVCVFKWGALAGLTWAVERFVPAATPTWVNLAPPVVTYATATPGNLYQLGKVRARIASISYSVTNVDFSVGSYSASIANRGNLQGRLGWTCEPVSLTSAVTANALGYVGAAVDLYLGDGSFVPTPRDGELFDKNGAWFLVGKLLWPNPANTAPMVA